MGGYEDRVDGLLRPSGMAAPAPDQDVETSSTRHHRTGAQRKAADVEPRSAVKTEQAVAGKPLEEPVVEHGIRAGKRLLGGLEYEMDRPVEIARSRQITGRP